MKKYGMSTKSRERHGGGQLRMGAGRAALLTGASTLAMAALPPAALAQDDLAAEEDVIVVTGIRGSLERAMDVKRNSDGIVDAISAEDIGKFPDTNLAESLQRITGVSIDRVNGEGSQITVRGFGPGFNLITLNGRTLPTAEVGVIGQRDNYAAGGDRSFDFSNLASEGVSALEVYKTGQSILPSGGIGATVNIKTRRPLDTPGLSGTLSAKALHDTSVSRGSDVTPEISGLFNWTDDNEVFGLGVFASYSERDSGAPTQQINDWIVQRSEDGTIASSYLRGGGTTVVENGPAPGQLYAIPQDSRYDFSDLTRKRFNGQVVGQFRPIETLTFTADFTYAQNESDELRYEQTNWFATPMDQIIFDNSGPVATAVFMQENNDGTKDMGFEQTNRATKDELKSFGFNADWEVTDNFRAVFDCHISTAESGGNNPLGHTATFATFGAPVILQHSVDYRSGYPIQSYTIDDSVKGNGNGVLDAGDLGSQVFRSNSSRMEQDINEFDLRFIWENDQSRLIVGANYRDTEMTRDIVTTQQDLGSWGISNPGDIEQFAPGVVETYCLACEFKDLPVGQADVAFRADAVDLWNLLVPAYSSSPINTTPTSDTVEEDIFAAFAQFNMEGEFLGRRARINAGIRYEDTQVNSASAQSIPSGILWTADNDFLVVSSGDIVDVNAKGSYHHILPNIDIQVDVFEDVVARASYSKTIGRAAYSNLFASIDANAPNRPTVLGGQVTGTAQNPELLPLESNNFDISLEWYYGDASYVSAGYFRKETTNFIGTGVVDRNLFDLRDQTSGAAGSRSGDALDVIADLGIDQSEANLFTLVALIDANGGNVAAARAEFESNLVGGALPQSYVDSVLASYDVSADANDPLMVFAVEQPLNADDGTIDGWEFAWQHFLGDTGLGVAANYTIVNGDITQNPASDPSENQFALVGLSDTANVTLIYENYGVSARLAYNWRDTFLQATNQTGDRSGVYVEDYGQLDLSVSYDIMQNLTVSFEGINLTGADQRIYHRVPEQIYYAYELSPRFTLGLRYKF